MIGIFPPSKEEEIKRYWRALNVISLFLIPSIGMMWLFTPYVTRNLKSHPQLILRIVSISYGLVGSLALLYSANELTRMKPKIDALNKREIADFKHSLASDLYLANSTNSAIAEAVIMVKRDELGLPRVSGDGNQETQIRQGLPEITRNLQDDGNSDLPVNVNSVNSVNSNQLLFSDIRKNHWYDEVEQALETGLSDTKIITEIMGYKGRNYAEGKAILEKIKEEIEEDTD